MGEARWATRNCWRRRRSRQLPRAGAALTAPAPPVSAKGAAAGVVAAGERRYRSGGDGDRRTDDAPVERPRRRGRNGAAGTGAGVRHPPARRGSSTPVTVSSEGRFRRRHDSRRREGRDHGGASVPAPPAGPSRQADAVVLDAAHARAPNGGSGQHPVEGTDGRRGRVVFITSAAGDIFVSGTLRTGDMARASRGLTLQAPSRNRLCRRHDRRGWHRRRPGRRRDHDLRAAADRDRGIRFGERRGRDGWRRRRGCHARRARSDVPGRRGALARGAGTTAGGRGRSADDRHGAAPSRRWISSTRAGARPATGSRACPARSASASRRRLARERVRSAFGARWSGRTMGGSGGGITLEPQMGNLVIAASVDSGGGDARSSRVAGRSSATWARRGASRSTAGTCR